MVLFHMQQNKGSTANHEAVPSAVVSSTHNLNTVSLKSSHRYSRAEVKQSLESSWICSITRENESFDPS